MPIWNIEDLQQGEEDKMGEQEQYRIVEVDSPTLWVILRGPICSQNTFP